MVSGTLQKIFYNACLRLYRKLEWAERLLNVSSETPGIVPHQLLTPHVKSQFHLFVIHYLISFQCFFPLLNLRFVNFFEPYNICIVPCLITGEIKSLICVHICTKVRFCFFIKFILQQNKRTHQRMCIIPPAPPLTSCEGRAHITDLFMLHPFNTGIKDKPRKNALKQHNNLWNARCLY